MSDCLRSIDVIGSLQHLLVIQNDLHHKIFILYKPNQLDGFPISVTKGRASDVLAIADFLYIPFY
jgi:hypothetical protein